MIRSRPAVKRLLVVSTAAVVIMSAGSAAADDVMPTKAAPISNAVPSAFDWSGFYVGGHAGYASGSSAFTATDPGWRRIERHARPL
ncbi:MAG: hypothetical protein ABSC37_07525 [Xanthobacteraceae bacterium]